VREPNAWSFNEKLRHGRGVGERGSLTMGKMVQLGNNNKQAPVFGFQRWTKGQAHSDAKKRTREREER